MKIVTFGINNIKMSGTKEYNYLQEYVIKLQSQGEYCFSMFDLFNEFDNSAEAIRMALNRLIKKKRIANIRKEFYVIVPPEYLNRGVLPPPLFVADLMKFMERDYYVCLLSAAVYHGATHQQPQSFFIATGYPVIKKISSNGLHLNFISKRNLVHEGVEKKKTDTGYMNISGAELTAIDLVTNSNRIGGMERAAILIEEIMEKIDVERMKIVAEAHGNISSLQRLGFIFDKILFNEDLAVSVKDSLKRRRMINIQLSTKHNRVKTCLDNDWKIYVNANINLE